MSMDEKIAAVEENVKPNSWWQSPNRTMRALIFEHALIAAILGLNPFPGWFSASLVVVGVLSVKMMRDVGATWGYPKGHDILAIAGNLAGGVGALIMAALAWGLMIVGAIYFPVCKAFALAAAFSTFTWIAGQATNQYYASGKATEPRDTSQMQQPKGWFAQQAGGGGSRERRQLLLGLFGAIATNTGLYHYAKQREWTLDQAQLATLARQSPAYVDRYLEQAFSGDTVSSEAVQAIKNQLRLVPPTLPYDRALSKRLIRCARLGTEQYLTGTIVEKYDGAIARLPSFDPSLSQYEQVATLIGPEEATTTRKLELAPNAADPALLQPDALRENLDQIESIVKNIGGQVVTVKWLNPVYWGFVLRSPDHNILVFRGTQQTNEWIQNVLAQQISHSDLLPFQFVGKVHRGFATLYGAIAQQVLTTIQTLDHTRPLYITGHSLGASLATLAAMDLALRLPALRPHLRLYSYACPRVGNVEFAEAHSRLIPNAYRVVNVADGIPTAPPTQTGQLIFAHPGQAWGFVDYNGDVILAHFVSVYKKAIEAEQEQLLNRRT